MTKRATQRLQALRRATEKHSSTVERKLSRHGRKADSAMMESAAKYYVALRKLAAK